MSNPSDTPAYFGGTRGDLTGRRLGDLQLLRRLGRGGMADVYVANQLSLGRRVALKVLRSDLANDAAYVERFRREARAAARLTHPNIVQVYEVGCVDSLHYIAQEYVDGCNLREQLERGGPLTPDQAVVVLQSVADALTAASTEGITHRDIKPENIMVSRRGDVKVADFGLASVTRGQEATDLTQVGVTMGTPLYMSPEQVQGKAVDVRSDLYSLGVTMYHLLVGRPPYEADAPLALAVKHLHDDPEPIEQARPIRDLPPWLCRAIERLMQKAPEDRFQSPQDLRQSIERALAEGGSVGQATETLAVKLDATRTLQRLMSQQARGRGMRPLLKWAALVLLPAAALGAGLALGGSRQPPRVSQLLQPQLEVPILDSVEAQYLQAVRLNEPEGWRKVAEAFPPSASPLNAAYAAKSSIQLARLYRSRENYTAAEFTLGRLLANPELPTLYRAVALYEQMRVARARGRTAAEEKYKQQLREVYPTLKNTPQKLTIFDALIDDELRSSLNLER
jgi:serine/threonine-protein kinase